MVEKNYILYCNWRNVACDSLRGHILSYTSMLLVFIPSPSKWSSDWSHIYLEHSDNDIIGGS